MDLKLDCTTPPLYLKMSALQSICPHSPALFGTISWAVCIYLLEMCVHGNTKCCSMEIQNVFPWKVKLVLVKSKFRTGQQWLVVKRVIVNTDCTKGHCEHWLLTSSEKSVSPNTDFLVKSVSPNTDFLVKSESTNSESLTCGRVTFLPCKNVTLQSY